MSMLAYEELRGSVGKEVWFRPPRYDARVLFPQSPPKVRLRSGIHKLQDISLGGLAVLCNQSAEDVPEIGEVVPLTVQQLGFSIFESEARVCRREDTVFGSKLAFNFIDSFIEFDKLLSRNTQAHISARAENNAANDHLIPREYRLFCADVLGTLRSYNRVIADSAALAKTADCTFDLNSCYDSCEARLLQQWRIIWRTGNDLIRAIRGDRDILQATKQFSELVLTPEFSLGPIWDRSYAKPMGYPGDFEIMNQVYSWQRLGSNAYSMLLHRVGLEVAECIKTRMEVVRKHITTVMGTKYLERPARILSLGSGPAREIELALSGARTFDGRVEFTLIDQESAALRYAFEKTYPHIMRLQGRARLQCVNTSFTDILRGMNALDDLPQQDMIYSVGLVDYLTDRRAAMLVHRLYDALAPGGLLVIGNMNETPLSNLWPMECIVDWSLYYRNNEEMLNWAEPLRPTKAWTETESTDRVRLLFVRKP
jgi:hypothetical protein